MQSSAKGTRTEIVDTLASKKYQHLGAKVDTLWVYGPQGLENPKPLNARPLNPKPLNPKPLHPKPLNPSPPRALENPTNQETTSGAKGAKHRDSGRKTPR